jgi:hypothetical protein
VNRMTLACAAAAAVAGAGPFAVSGPAAAAPPACRTAVTTLVDRPDSGFHGDWAKDAITRTVKICEAAPPVTDKVATDRTSTYTATVVDTGTFTTVAGHSPGAGKPLVAGVKGLLAGGFTATFTAKPDFKNYQGFDKDTYSGTEPSSTSDWVKNLWGGRDFTPVTNLVGWKWTYWTCSKDVTKAVEKWVNADPDVNDGDITGKACPAPVESASASAPTGGGAGGGEVGGGGASTGGLPVTGANVGILAGLATALIAIGMALFITARRRRREFTA